MPLDMTPSRPQKVRAKQSPNKEAAPIPEGIDESEIAKPTAFDTNKYAPKPRIGRPSLGAPERVTKIGLGGLSTTTTYGNPDV